MRYWGWEKDKNKILIEVWALVTQTQDNSYITKSDSDF